MVSKHLFRVEMRGPQSQESNALQFIVIVLDRRAEKQRAQSFLISIASDCQHRMGRLTPDVVVLSRCECGREKERKKVTRFAGLGDIDSHPPRDLAMRPVLEVRLQLLRKIRVRELVVAAPEIPVTVKEFALIRQS